MLVVALRLLTSYRVDPLDDAALVRRRHVLIVDDEPPLRDIMAEALIAEGYGVETCDHGAHALELLRRDRPDVIVLDLMMPVLDGWAFIEGYRDVAGADIPIVSVSAAMNRTVAERLKDLGVRICLAKSFDIEALIGAVQHAIGGAPARLDTDLEWQANRMGSVHGADAQGR